MHTAQHRNDRTYPAALVLLAGVVRATSLARAANRARLNLPIRSDATLERWWSGLVDRFRTDLDRPQLPVLVASNLTARAPENGSAWCGGIVHRDREEPRGSGGALRDIAELFPVDARLLVAPAHAIFREPISVLHDELAACDADVVIHADAGNDSPTGLLLARCGALRAMPARGYIDLKEQGLPQVASRHEVRVVRGRHPAPLPVRTLAGYVRALRALHGGSIGDGENDEHWLSAFGIQEPGAVVHAGARVHDSVILSGAVVSSGAVVVRSLVGPGGRVGVNQVVVGELVGRSE